LIIQVAVFLLSKHSV